MRTVKYTNSNDFQCLEDLRETSREINLVHMGKEECKPYHAFAGTRDEYIIHFVLSGSGFYSVNGNMWPISAGQMFLIYPDEPIVYCADKNTPWTYVWVGFKGLGTDDILKHCGFSKSHLIQTAPNPEKYMCCFDDFFKHITLSFTDSLYREAILLRLLAILSEHHVHLVVENKQEKVKSDNNAYVDLAINYINEIYMKDIGVSDIADKIGISRSHLNSMFQKELNMSIQRFLIDFRMHKAANLLVSTNMSIKEISNQVGYKDQLVFSKAFKKKFGLSPKNYRTYTDQMEIRKNRPQKSKDY